MSEDATNATQTQPATNTPDEGVFPAAAAADAGTDDATGTDATGTDDAAAAGTDDAAAAGTDTDAGKNKSDEVPDTYGDISLPQGVTINPKYIEAMTPVFKELGLTQANVQRLVEANAEFAGATRQNQVDEFNQLVGGWLAEAKADKEIGGDKFERSVSNASVALEKLGTPGLKQLMRDYGIGNNPEVIRFFNKVGEILREDSDASNNTGANSGKPDVLTELYGDQNTGRR